MRPQDQVMWMTFIAFCVIAVLIAYYFLGLERLGGWSAVFVVFVLFYFLFRLFRFS